MEAIVNVIEFVNKNEGFFLLLTSIITIIVTIYIARMPYKKNVDITMVIENTYQHDHEFDNECAIVENLTIEEFHKNYIFIRYKVTNYGLYSLLIRKVAIEQRRAGLWKCVSSKEIDVLNQGILLPTKPQEGAFSVKSSIPLEEINESKVRLVLYFQGSIKKYKFSNCIINKLQNKNGEMG